MSSSTEALTCVLTDTPGRHPSNVLTLTVLLLNNTQNFNFGPSSRSTCIYWTQVSSMETIPPTAQINRPWRQSQPHAYRQDYDLTGGFQRVSQQHSMHGALKRADSTNRMRRGCQCHPYPDVPASSANWKFWMKFPDFITTILHLSDPLALEPHWEVPSHLTRGRRCHMLNLVMPNMPHWQFDPCHTWKSMV